MSLTPLLSASPVIQIHAFAAMLAFGLGALVLFRRKGDKAHRLGGRVWVGLMALVAISSLFIWELRVFGLFSPIHLLSLGTLVSLWQGVRLARKHRISAHRQVMQATYLLALVVTGWFTFMPGRIMNQVVFGPEGAGPMQSATFMALSLLVGGAAIWLVRRAGGRPTRPALKQNAG